MLLHYPVSPWTGYKCYLNHWHHALLHHCVPIHQWTES